MKTKKKSSAKKVSLKRFFELSQEDFFFIGGPCVIESEDMAFKTASALKEICYSLNIPFIFKASYDKANRTSASSYRGVGMAKGLRILGSIKKKLSIPVLTDVHSPQEAIEAAKVVDVLQIPAFLCRQTDLLNAAAETGIPVNIKKGQFLSPYEAENMVNKALAKGNKNIMLTERGFSFGYNNLVVDMKSIAIMKKLGYPVIIDATHSVQRPGGAGTSSGGDREFVETIARASVAAGANGLFMEVHPDPDKALSDKATQYPLKSVKKFLEELKNIFETVKR
ncbi:MAG: 2-dehydro-3-deoxyphosphooctonate aldolase [Candidatus Aerophobetes bacterium ADurb.Bin490]|nr:MAG: 2-dehydro-3-deoxyphosphooctonate aldolase [Candidatus Aerophobetes bacterium ADurb.Bin490]HPI03750.1 3-deoxy-8-phosphooctulonate synthase [Candidatus Goldiibacteriota bacterium]HRQ44257.1 3-deoxy-8-phosphooctulonate synthase [Candidatus Goldiibacteriota bacterium]